MAFANKIGSLFKKTLCSNPSAFQAIRLMSSSKLFIGGLSYGTDDQSLREAFAGYGEVVEARVILDRDSGRSRGFGFVTYTTPDDASNAVGGMDGKDLQGRNIRVSYANDRPRDRGFGGGGFGGGRGYERGNYGPGRGGVSDFGGGGITDFSDFMRGQNSAGSGDGAGDKFNNLSQGGLKGGASDGKASEASDGEASEDDLFEDKHKRKGDEDVDDDDDGAVDDDDGTDDSFDDMSDADDGYKRHR